MLIFIKAINHKSNSKLSMWDPSGCFERGYPSKQTNRPSAVSLGNDTGVRLFLFWWGGWRGGLELGLGLGLVPGWGWTGCVRRGVGSVMGCTGLVKGCTGLRSWSVGCPILVGKCVLLLVLQQVLWVELILLKHDIDARIHDVVHAAVIQDYAPAVFGGRHDVAGGPSGVISDQYPCDEHWSHGRLTGVPVGKVSIPGKITSFAINSCMSSTESPIKVGMADGIHVFFICAVKKQFFCHIASTVYCFPLTFL